MIYPPPRRRLEEQLPVRDELALEEAVDVGRPVLLDERPPRRARVVDLRPRVAQRVVVRLGEVLDRVPPHEPAARDLDRQARLRPRHEHRAEGPLAHGVGPLDKPTNRVGAHELLLVLVVVLEAADPERPALRVEHLPELLLPDLGRVVLVGPLPLVAVERRRALLVQDLQRMLDLLRRGGGRRRRGLLLLGLLLLRRLLLLRLLLAALGSSGRALRLHLRLGQRDVADDGHELRLVHAQVEPAEDVGKLGPELRVHGELRRVDERLRWQLLV